MSTRNEPVSLDSLIALNDEIAALARAGIPLETGLGGMTSSASRELRLLTDDLADQLQRGTSLPAALERQSDRFPPLYRAIVAAGLRTGRLPDALEMLTRFARSLRETRRQFGLAMIYPGIILLLAYGLVLFLLREVGSVFVEMYRSPELPKRPWIEAIGALNRTMEVWWWIPPLLAAAFGVWLWLSSRSMFGRSALGQFASACVPWMRGTILNFHRANFSDLLALLIEHGVPLADALVLAGDASGDRRLRRAAHALNEEIRQGRSLSDAIASRRAFPPFMRWMIGTAERQGALGPALRQLGEMYRRRALVKAEWFRIIMPVLLTLVVGGSAVLLYALLLFYPISRLLTDLTLE